MGGIVILVLIGFLTFGIYLLIFHIKRIDWKAFKISLVFGIVLTLLFGALVMKMAKNQSGWCDRFHVTNSYPPSETKTAMEFFEKGNYQYDLGDCRGAIDSYSKSVELNDNYPQSLNNRGYTYMMMGEFENALKDFNASIDLDPNYVNALMNRADTLAYRIDRREEAVKDYEKIIELTGRTSTPVCPHLADAKYGGKGAISILRAIPEIIKCRNGNN